MVLRRDIDRIWLTVAGSGNRADNLVYHAECTLHYNRKYYIFVVNSQPKHTM